MRCSECGYFKWALRNAYHPEDGWCFADKPKRVISGSEACWEARPKKLLSPFDLWRMQTEDEGRKR